ncbi:pilus assembly protein PilZ [Ralstonia sp. A12]|uniref:pilus assembly PilX family protein n=1 Tax=Ralstonia sp. A12 TaxID=1217052 RepID=UPI000574D605|nr:pilus assembly protein PilZ [Ralstonia sp. A12]KHK56141.1 pilus assembly protein PilZ [Ralstonia sp. A12]
MLNTMAKTRGFALPVVMAVVALLGLLTMAPLHLLLDQRRRVSLAADHAQAKHAAEYALNAAECELSSGTGTPTTRDCSLILPVERTAAFNPVTPRGFVAGSCGMDNMLGLCQPRPGQSLWAMAGLLDENTLAMEVEPPQLIPNSNRKSARHARYVIEPIADRWPGLSEQASETSPPHLFRITAAGFGTDPAVSVVLQSVFRPRVSDRSTPQLVTLATPPIDRPSGTITQTVHTTLLATHGDPPHAAQTETQTVMLGRLSWRELITEGTP